MINMYELCLTHAHADRALRASIATSFEKYQITMMEWLLLGVVQSGATSGVSMTYIASKLDVTLPQVTALVGKLTPLKLISQQQSASDKRSRLVKLTTKGKQTLDDATKKLNQNNPFADIEKNNLNNYKAILESLAAKT